MTDTRSHNSSGSLEEAASVTVNPQGFSTRTIQNHFAASHKPLCQRSGGSCSILSRINFHCMASIRNRSPMVTHPILHAVCFGHPHIAKAQALGQWPRTMYSILLLVLLLHIVVLIFRLQTLCHLGVQIQQKQFISEPSMTTICMKLCRWLSNKNIWICQPPHLSRLGGHKTNPNWG